MFLLSHHTSYIPITLQLQKCYLAFFPIKNSKYVVASKSGKSKSLSGDRNNLILRDTPIVLDHIHILLHILYGNGLHTWKVHCVAYV